MITLLIGLLIGYWAKDVYTMLKALYDERKEIREANKAGVVRPIANKITKSSPIDLSTSTGGVRRPTPNEISLEHIVERDRVLKENHS